MKYTFDWKEYAKTARQMVAEGCVLLKNEDKALPIRPNEKVSVFGRIQFDYIKSGTGSGGMVNAPYVVSILDALREDRDIRVNEELVAVYEEWIKENPFDNGVGWATEPWCQKEMEVETELAEAAAKASDLAIIIIGRTAGEDKDNSATEGSYYLSKEEEQMIDTVTKAFDRTVVLLNVGNIIDMKWVDKYNPSAVMYCWQGGCEGGHGVVDVLNGNVSPSGKLVDTIAYNIEDYPSTKNFGDENRNFYEEDIFVGYRYFETAAKDKVMYPFGFGMSYTSFEINGTMNIVDDKTIRVDARVKNTGKRMGKEVVQVYFEAPSGKLSKPARTLVGFAKTDALLPGTDETLSVQFDFNALASFDDSGATGHKDAYVLEAGEYIIYAGSDVRSAELIGSFNLAETIVTEQLKEACAPVKPMKRMTLWKDESGEYVEATEDVPLRTYDIEQRILDNRPLDRACTGDMGYKFKQVMTGEVSTEDFLDQLTDEELICMSRGEGMCSPKVTPGVAAAFGGVTTRLNEHYGMPIACCSDGPSGIRMDSGTPAFSLPNGVAQGCSFNLPLITRLYEFEGQELRFNKIDTLLGPGINIHRNPLNGRNFEYYSEDPYVTGSCAAAELKGLHKYNVTGTCKHFATNNQESRRHFVDAVVSARALREIYLKPFEIAVKEGGAHSIMTTYGPLNGVYTGSNYDLTTTVLREEWGFDGIAMTDWWAKLSESSLGGNSGVKFTSTMISAQNDVYMVTADSESNSGDDNAAKALAEGALTRGELLRNAKNICSVLRRFPAGLRLVDTEDEIEVVNAPKGADKKQNIMPPIKIENGKGELDLTGLDTQGGSDNLFTVNIKETGKYEMTIRMKSDMGELAQTTLVVSTNKVIASTFTINGTNGQWIEKKMPVDCSFQNNLYINLFFAQTGIDIEQITLVKVADGSMGDKREAGVIV